MQIPSLTVQNTFRYNAIIAEANSKHNLEVKQFKTTEDLIMLRKIAEDRDKWKELLKQFAALHEANSACTASRICLIIIINIVPVKSSTSVWYDIINNSSACSEVQWKILN